MLWKVNNKHGFLSKLFDFFPIPTTLDNGNQK